MSTPMEPYAVLAPGDARWRESNMMKIPNANLAEQLGSEKLGARLWRLPPYSANTWHRHLEQDETTDRTVFYPEDPRQLPSELSGRKWPPE